MIHNIITLSKLKIVTTMLNVFIIIKTLLYCETLSKLEN